MKFTQLLFILLREWEACCCCVQNLEGRCVPRRVTGCTRHLSRCNVKREHGTILPQLGHSVRTVVYNVDRLLSPLCFCFCDALLSLFCSSSAIVLLSLFYPRQQVKTW